MTQKLLKAVKGARASDACWNRFLHFVLLWHAATSEFIVPVVDTPESCTEEVAYHPCLICPVNLCGGRCGSSIAPGKTMNIT